MDERTGRKAIGGAGIMIVQIFTLPDSEQFLRWQISHYTQRLSEAKTTEEKAFLRQTRWQLKQKLNSLLN